MSNKAVFALLCCSLVMLSSQPAHLSFAADVETAGDLKVSGVIESTSGGFKFPDGSLLTTSGLNGLLFNVGFVVDDSASNTGNLLSGAIKFGSDSSGEGIASQRTSGTAQNGLDFFTGSASRLTIKNNGYVGIGTRDPYEQLEITGNLRLPPTTATTGIIKSGFDTLLHTYGAMNFFSGESAGNLYMTGSRNTGVGESALHTNTTGGWNAGVGSYALAQNTTGGSNSALGSHALYGNTTGNGNTAVGNGALTTNVTGSSNTAVGNNALWDSTGYGNTAAGTVSLRYNTSGSYNTALGTQAGVTSTEANANTSGSYNTFIGYNSGPGTSTQLTNATAIGANALVSQINSLVLGGTGANAVKVGIGTAAPTEALDVVGNVKISGTLAPGSLSSASIGSAALADSAVTSAKLASGAVTGVKLADGAVTSTKLANSAVTASKLNIDANVNMNNKDLSFRGDSFHGLGWYGSGKEFAGQNLNGPALYGNSGGALGTVDDNGQKIALKWDSSGTIKAGSGMTGTPLAYGVVQSNGSCTVKSANVTCSGANGVYIISITGEDYDTDNFVTVVTISGGSTPLFSSVWTTGVSPNRSMSVQVKDLSGFFTGNKFSFVTFKP